MHLGARIGKTLSPTDAPVRIFYSLLFAPQRSDARDIHHVNRNTTS